MSCARGLIGIVAAAWEDRHMVDEDIEPGVREPGVECARTRSPVLRLDKTLRLDEPDR